MNRNPPINATALEKAASEMKSLCFQAHSCQCGFLPLFASCKRVHITQMALGYCYLKGFMALNTDNVMPKGPLAAYFGVKYNLEICAECTSP